MRFLLFSDLQAELGSERLFSNPQITLQEWRVRKFFKRLSKIYKDYKCDGVIDLGDTTDNRSSIAVPIIEAVGEGIARFPNTTNNFKLIGNHEQYVKSTDVHAGRLFQSNFIIIPSIDTVTFKDFVLVFCSFPSDYDTAYHECRRVIASQNKPVYFFGHFEVRGAQMGSGISLVGMPADVCEGAKLSFLGHIHKPQEVADNVFYIGSPFQQNFGESGEDKRVGVLDTVKGKVEWIPISGFPIYKKLTINEWEANVTAESEDRIKVILTSPDEAERFYGHELAYRAIPDYQYAASTPESTPASGGDWSMRSAISRWVKANPPESKGIVGLNEEDMVGIGADIAVGG